MTMQKELQRGSQEPAAHENPQGCGFVFALRSGALLSLGVSFKAQMTLQTEPHPLCSKDAGKAALNAERPPTPFPRV